MGQILNRMGWVLPLIALLAFCTPASSPEPSHEAPDISGKINGISLVGNPTPITGKDLEPLQRVSTNWIALMPFAYGRFDSSRLTWKDATWQWWGESKEGVEACIQLAQAKGMHVMIKPQLWFDFGKYTGYFKLEKEADWQAFEREYEGFILQYAELSEQYNLDLFCIGTELIAFVENRPDFWTNLIEKVKRVYSGKLTYAGNWDSYDRVHFWDQLDYLGVDAYFPITDAQTPDIEACVAGWAKPADEMRDFAAQHDLQVLFTEWGYRSTDYCCRRPWDYNENRPMNETAQANAIAGVFEALWDAPWFAGGFLWKWNAHHAQAGGSKNTRFTPQNKRAEEVIKSYFEAHAAP